MNMIAGTRIDRHTSDRAQRVRSRTHLSMSEMLRIGLLRVLEEFEAKGSISSGDGVPLANARAKTPKPRPKTPNLKPQTSNFKLQTSNPEP